MITCGPSIYKERHDRVLYQLVRAVSDNLGLKIPKQLRAPGGKIAPGVMGTVRADLSHQWPGYRIEVILVVVGDLGLNNQHAKTPEEIPHLQGNRNLKANVRRAARSTVQCCSNHKEAYDPVAAWQEGQEGGLAWVCKSLQKSNHGDKKTGVYQDSRFKNIIH